jgi:hypothetical protein
MAPQTACAPARGFVDHGEWAVAAADTRTPAAAEQGWAARWSKDGVAHGDSITRACIAEYWRKF